MAIPKITSYPLPRWEQTRREEGVKPRVNWVIDPSRATLLIHDMQDYFLSFYDSDAPLVRGMIAHIKALRAQCRALRLPIFYTAQPTRQSPAARALLTDMWGPGLTDKAPEAARIVSDLTPAPEEIVLTKWRYSAFAKTDLRKHLEAMGRDQLILCGVYASIGCLATTLDAFMMDVKSFLIADATADFSLADHEMALRYVESRCGRVLSTAEACGFLGQ